MKLFLLSSLLLFASTTFGKELSYTASTPAGKQIRNFLGINQSDSIDFIRWHLKVIDAKEFILSCSYGLSKANTNGFVHENKVTFSGTITHKNDVLSLNHDGKTQGLQILNDNILHLLNNDGTLMAGNGGWSYTLNAMTQVSTEEINVTHQAVSFKDSILFEGRTPCKGIEEMMSGETRPECYKKKWLVYLYRNTPASGTYRIGSTVGSYKGNWKLKEDAAGKTVYTLELNNGRTLNLLHVDNNIVYLMNPKGELMVGDHDFSYSLNRRVQ